MTPERKAILARLIVDPDYEVFLHSIATAMSPEGATHNIIALVHREVGGVAEARVPKTIRISKLMRDERIMLFVQYATNTELGRIVRPMLNLTSEAH